jgi:hypothetical protein
MPHITDDHLCAAEIHLLYRIPGEDAHPFTLRGHPANEFGAQAARAVGTKIMRVGRDCRAPQC